MVKTIYAFILMSLVYANGWHFIAENAGAGWSDPAKILQGWMQSPPHRRNILNPNFCDIGVGYACNEKGTYKGYWTLDFGCR